MWCLAQTGTPPITEDGQTLQATGEAAAEPSSGAIEQLHAIGGGIGHGEIDTGAMGALVIAYVIPALVALLFLVVAFFLGKFLGRMAAAPVRAKEMKRWAASSASWCSTR